MTHRLAILFFVLSFSFYACQPADPAAGNFPMQDLPPDQRYGELFEAVQLARIFPDGKTFVDCTPKFNTTKILADYQMGKDLDDFDLKEFVDEHFELPKNYASGFRSDSTRTAIEHIEALWPVLTRQPSEQPDRGSLIPLPYPYVVPGGRFGEIYYWDSYFTMLGLRASDKVDMVENMVKNFAWLIDSIGYIPNGNRTYFKGRSQPPFFSSMVALLAEEEGLEVLYSYLPQLEKEYKFWMRGEAALSEGQQVYRGHLVRMPDGEILNRYWDQNQSPRAEMYADDVELAEETDRPERLLYSHIRAACESGWDFSSRWFTDPHAFGTIETAYIVPVDLNSLLFHLEQTLEGAYLYTGKREKAERMGARAQARQEALVKYCWNEQLGWFTDYHRGDSASTGRVVAAGMYPLYFQMVTDADMAEKAAATLRDSLLMPGGIVTTTYNTGQQWDAPNGWAPLQWISIQGLRNYGQGELADSIKQRWVKLNLKVYEQTGKMVEKYNVEDLSLDAGGGEYPLQDGFGWTNGVLMQLMTEPD